MEFSSVTSFYGEKTSFMRQIYGVLYPNVGVLRDKCSILLLIVIVTFAFDMIIIREPKEGS